MAARDVVGHRFDIARGLVGHVVQRLEHRRIGQVQAQLRVVGVGGQDQFIQVQHANVDLHHDGVLAVLVRAQYQVARRLLAVGQQALMAYQLVELFGEVVAGVVEIGLDVDVGGQLEQRLGQHLLLDAVAQHPRDAHRVGQVGHRAQREQACMNEGLAHRHVVFHRHGHDEQRRQL
jgi:hypothetical protein